MSEERTEAPTPHRRHEARQRGQVAKSVEINSAIILLTAFWLLRVVGPTMYDALNVLLRRSFTALPSTEINFNTIRSGGLAVTGLATQAVAPLVVTLMAVGIGANLAQVGLTLSRKALLPDPSRINPLKGAQRIFSGRGLVDLFKSLLKLLVIGFVVYWSLRDNYDGIVSTSRMTLPASVGLLTQIGLTIGVRTALVLLIIAAADYLYQRYEFEKSLRMTKQEVRDEMKRYENPQLKSRIRSRQRELALTRMMAAVPEADVVITNPTHLAVALRYDRQKMRAPHVVAKGQRLVAERIKSKAGEHGVPLVENKPLARALFKSVEVGQGIPAELYQAVAEVLAFVYRLKSKPLFSPRTGSG